MKLNVMETIEEWAGTGRISPRYGATCIDFTTIKNESSGLFDSMCNSFTFGYAQGYKAAIAEMKRKECAAV